MNNKKTGLILSYGYTFINMLSGIFLSAFILRNLGDFEYGLYQAISSFVNYLVILEFGTGTVMSRDLLLAKKNGDERNVKSVTSTMFWVTAILAGVIIVLGIVFYYLIPSIYHATIPAEKIPYSQNMFVIMIAYLVISFFSQTVTGMFLGNEDYNIGNIFKITSLLFRVVLIVVIISHYKYSIMIALIDMVLSLIFLVFELIYTRRKYIVSFRLKYFSSDILKKSLPLCVALLLQTIINQANGSVDKVVISIEMSMESVAHYSVAAYVYNMFNSLLTIPIAMYLPQVSKNIIGNQYGKELQDTLISSSRFNSLICGTLLFGFFAVGRQFICIIYGESYVDTWCYALIVLVPTFISMVHGCIINVLNILNKRIICSYMLLISTAINIILTIIFVKYWGIIGAVLGTAIGTIIGQIIMLNFYYIKHLNINVLGIYRSAFRGILPIEIISAIVGFFVGSVIVNKYLSFLAGGFALVVCECLLLWLWGLNRDEKTVILRIINKLKRSN